MIVEEIKNKILDHIEKQYSEEVVSAASSKFQIEIPDSPEKGNLTCNIALILGNITKNNPKQIGLEVGNILKELSLISSIEVAGPGFINIFLSHSGILKIIKDILDKNTISHLGTTNLGNFIFPISETEPTIPSIGNDGL